MRGRVWVMVRVRVMVMVRVRGGYNIDWCN
jgi:hypothetical protein